MITILNLQKVIECIGKFPVLDGYSDRYYQNIPTRRYNGNERRSRHLLPRNTSVCAIHHERYVIRSAVVLNNSMKTIKRKYAKQYTHL